MPSTRRAERWGAERGGIPVYDDGTSSNEDRLGAIGDIRFALEQGGLAGDDLLVIAADNLFEFSVADYLAFWRTKSGGSAIAVQRLADPSLASLYGVVELDSDDRVVGLEEKPEHPRSDLVSTATYLFPTLAAGADRPLPGRRQPARPAGAVPGLADGARAGVRLPLRRGVARHRRSRAAARGRQPVPGPGGIASARGVLTVGLRLFVTVWHRHVTNSALPWREWLLELVLPSRCVCCRQPGSAVCAGCRSGLSPILGPLCARCGAPTAWPVSSLPGVLGAFARIRLRPGRRLLPGPGSVVRSRVEGGRSPPPRSRGGRACRRAHPPAGRRSDRLHPTRRGSKHQARPSAGAGSRARAGATLGPRDGVVARTEPGCRPPDGPEPAGTSQEHARRVRRRELARRGRPRR